MIDYRTFVVITYKQIVPTGAFSWKYITREAREEIFDYWFLEDVLRSFRTYRLPKYGKIISIRKEYKEVNKSRNHHNYCDEIVLD